MRRLTFWSGWDLKQLKSGIEVLLHILICFNGTPMWAYIKDSCKQLFLLQDSVAQSKAVCLDYKSGKPIEQLGLKEPYTQCRLRYESRRWTKNKAAKKMQHIHESGSGAANESCRHKEKKTQNQLSHIFKINLKSFGKIDPNLPNQPH